MAKRGNCKFFARGSCYKGEQCEYSHARKDSPVNQQICSFYQKGNCTYGSRCKYKHVKASQTQWLASSSENRQKSLASDSVIDHTTKGSSSWVPKAPKLLSSNKHGRIPDYKHQISSGNGDVGESSSTTASKHLFCTFAAANCPLEEKCILIHGDQCTYCKKYCLHPTEQKERENHLNSCDKKEKYLQALKDSQEIECYVCLERVLSKPSPVERKFGLLPECDHAFCLSCIRNWRNSTPTTEVNVTNTVRACPVCRKLSYFVVPSAIWFSTKEEKEEIINNYKANCKLIDCKHFNSGDGNCPFGNSCFYKHTVKPGSYTWMHGRPPAGTRRVNNNRNRNRYVNNMLSMFSEFDLESEEYFSIMRDMEGFEDMSPFEMMTLSDMLARSGSGPFFNPGDSDDEEMDIFQMAALSEAMDCGYDNFCATGLESDDWCPMDEAFLSIMQSNMDDDESSEEDY